MESSEKKVMNPMVLGLIAIAVVAVVAVGAFSMRNSSTQNRTGENTVQPTVQVMQGSGEGESTNSAKKMAAYKNGMYEAVGEYTSPGGEEEIGVSLTLENNLIKDVEVEVKATRPISKKLQEDFAANYKTQVVGKSIDEVNLGKVSGSSLTPKGFNDAIEKIKTEAAS
jgi:hypothetical protein